MAEFTPKMARAHCRRRIATIDASLVAMARHWDDLDMTVIDHIDNLRAELDDLLEHMDDAVAYSSERAVERTDG